MQIKAIIRNTGNLGVIIDINQIPNRLNASDLPNIIRQRAPPMAFIEEISLVTLKNQEKNTPNSAVNNVQIGISGDATGKGLALPPDIATCETCLKDLRNPAKSRFFEYPFVSCAQCGPRFTIMHALPYDRPASTMAPFKFCTGSNSCSNDYAKPDERRFHAETFGCQRCGPYYFSVKPPEAIQAQPKPAPVDDLIPIIQQGGIAAIKGIGGVHLVCRADDPASIALLRERKRDRKFKPFAIMVPDIALAREYCEISPQMEESLTSYRRPIVLLPRKKNSLPEDITPGMPTLGIILPYMGLHHLLFSRLGRIPLIFTSGNVSGLPMAISNPDIISQLIGIADIFYLHNREIVQRCDDSVLRPVNDILTPIRRSRGFVPEYIRLPFQPRWSVGIALGPELNSTGAVARADRVFPTQHIGDVENLETRQFLAESIAHMQTLLKVQPQEIGIIAHDLHPQYNSTRLAQSIAADLKTQTLGTQHHHAHMAALMADHQLSIEERIIAITIDGIGYGDDGQPWGGEILEGNYSEYIRRASLQPVPMVGGDICVKYPARMLLCMLLSEKMKETRKSLDSDLSQFQQHIIPPLLQAGGFSQGETEINFLINQFQPSKRADLNRFPQSTSMGRLLDAAAVLFKACVNKTYQGEPAMRLEGWIWDAAPEKYFNLDDYRSERTIAGARLLCDYAELLIRSGSLPNEIKQKIMARSFVNDIASLFATVAIEKAKNSGIRFIGATGGVAYNHIIMNVLKRQIEGSGHTFLQHRRIPCGDAGISTGQLAIAAAKMRKY